MCVVCAIVDMDALAKNWPGALENHTDSVNGREMQRNAVYQLKLVFYFSGYFIIWLKMWRLALLRSLSLLLLLLLLLEQHSL